MTKKYLTAALLGLTALDFNAALAHTGLKDKLAVRNAEKSEADVVVAGDKLEARDFKPASGARAVATR